MIKKLIFPLLIGLFIIMPLIGTASAAQSVADGVVGTYTFHNNGYKVTVGYSPCGHDTFYVDSSGNIVYWHDALAVFYAKVQKGGGGYVQVWSHDINDGDSGDLQSFLVNSYGFGLTQTAINTLTTDASIYTC